MSRQLRWRLAARLLYSTRRKSPGKEYEARAERMLDSFKAGLEARVRETRDAAASELQAVQRGEWMRPVAEQAQGKLRQVAGRITQLGR